MHKIPEACFGVGRAWFALIFHKAGSATGEAFEMQAKRNGTLKKT
jgi:hypothetical protein